MKPYNGVLNSDQGHIVYLVYLVYLIQLVVPNCQEHFILKKHHINDIDWIFPNIEKCTLNKSKSDTSRKIWKPLLIYKPGNEASRQGKERKRPF